MKILMLNHEFPPVGGGASTITLELCRHLVRKGHHVDIVTMHFKNTPRFECVEGIYVYRTRALRKQANIGHTYELATFLLGALCKTLQLIRNNHYDIIHCHFLVPGGLLAWYASKISRVPYIITCHGSDVPGYNPDRFNLMHKLIAPAWRFLAKRTPLLTSPSNYLRQLILQTCPRANVDVIPNGIDTDRFTPAQKTKNILMCGRVLAYKGFQHVINAVKDIELDWTINLLGDGPYLTNLKQLAQQSKTPIKFWGWLNKNDPQFVKLYNDSAIFVIPSEAENFPTVILEAMSAQMAIISSTIGGCTEIVGDAGLLVEPGDIEGVRESILRLINDQSQRNKLANAAYQRVQQFSWDTIADKYIKTYQTLLNKMQ
jgi:glycosyltransferase involved in cell wall biosynthesis